MFKILILGFWIQPKILKLWIWNEFLYLPVCSLLKGQLISKGLFDVIVLTFYLFLFIAGRYHEVVRFPWRSCHNERNETSQSGPIIRSLHQGASILYHNRIHVQRKPIGLPSQCKQGWGHWSCSHVHCNTNCFSHELPGNEKLYP